MIVRSRRIRRRHATPLRARVHAIILFRKLPKITRSGRDDAYAWREYRRKLNLRDEFNLLEYKARQKMSERDTAKKKKKLRAR